MIATDTAMFDDEVLACPVCGHLYTHSGDVKVFSRPEGEDTATVQTVVRAADVKMLVVPDSENPSSRRGAVAVRFWCEMDHIWELRFVQHKGVTFVETEIVQEAA